MLKGLELVNNKIDNLTTSLKNDKYYLNKINKEEVAYKYLKSNILSKESELEIFNQIKQDLEVLEILKKRLYHKENYKFEVFTDSYYNVDAILMCDDLNNFEFMKDDIIEEYYKVKKWLEANKVGDNHD